MIEKIGHYSIENPGTIYDEESMTALQLAGRTAAKVNECIDQVNTNTENLPGQVTRAVQSHIDNGAFDEQIDQYAGEMEEQVANVDRKHDTNLANSVATLNKRIDNIVAHPGNGTVPTEVADARSDGMGNSHGSLRTAIQEQNKQMTNVQNGFVYLGGNACADITLNPDGSLTVVSNGRWAYRGSFGTFQFNWPEVGVNIADKMETLVMDNDTVYNVAITIPSYHTLVLNLRDKLLYLRNHAVCDAYDMVLVQNSYANPVRGTIVEEWMLRNILANAKNAYTVRGAYMYGGDGFKMEFRKDEETPALDVTMYGRPSVCYGSNDVYLATFDGDAIESIKDNVSYPRGEDNHIVATIKIPGWNSLVFNHIDKRWHFRWRANLQEGDILALATGYCQPLCGTLLEEWSAKKNQEFEQYLGSESIGYNPPEAVTRFAELMNGVDTTEKFMWFTDPHLCEGSEWQAEFETYKKQLKACYDATPTTFAVCGGDWLGNSDTKTEACFKLGFIGGQMRSAFGGKFYPVVGNHDTNYQGVKVEGADYATGRLEVSTLRNVWNTPTYYTFDGDNTRFFVFDSEIDWDLTLSLYKTEQLFWFAEQLKNNPAENMGAFIHIYYSLDEVNGTGNHTGEMGKKITEIAEAYNNRGSITFSGTTFDYSGATGKFRFVFAGHNHGDGITTENGIPVILTTKTREGGVPTFELCLVDYDNDKLHLCRVGSGESRTVDI